MQDSYFCAFSSSRQAAAPDGIVVTGSPHFEFHAEFQKCLDVDFGVALEALPVPPTTFLLYFVTGTDELTDESKEELKQILAELKHRPVPDIMVVGHTDTVGELEANDLLSAQRAERMKGFLVEIGIPGRQIQTAGRGEREPLVPTADNIDEPRNRRVEINVR